MCHKQVWGHFSITPELRKLRQENSKFGERLSYVGKAYLKRTRSKMYQRGRCRAQYYT